MEDIFQYIKTLHIYPHPLEDAFQQKKRGEQERGTEPGPTVNSIYITVII